jgi:hypothetical protein
MAFILKKQSPVDDGLKQIKDELFLRPKQAQQDLRYLCSAK